MTLHNRRTASNGDADTAWLLQWVLLLSTLTLSTPFVVRPRDTVVRPMTEHPTIRSISSLYVSIGLGPSEETDSSSSSGGGTDYSTWQAGVDYEIPNHEAHRTDRMTAMDKQCDDWFRQLLPSTSHPALLAGPIADGVRTQLLTPPPLVRVVEEADTSSSTWTPYVTTPLPWSVISPSYGLEQYGLPIPRRNAEAWRQFDVVGLTSIPVDGTLRPQTLLDTDTATTVPKLQAALERAGGWLSNDECEARLVYINGHYCPALSHESATARNIASLDMLTSDRTDDLTSFVSRLPDGYTDALVTPVPMQNNAPSLTSFRQLSEPNHNLGDPTTQFAVNTQQGTACFAALNTLSCTHMAYIHSPPPRDSENNASSESHQATKPIWIVHAMTADGGVAVPADATVTATSDASHAVPLGVALHPRTVIVAEPHSHVSVVQQCISLDLDGVTKPRPVLYNGYTQVWVKEHANVTHTMVEESGGVPVQGTEQASRNDIDAATTHPRALEAQRPALSNTIFETLDVHCAGAAASYTGTVLSMGGNGRTRLATSIALLEPTASCALSGFTLTGGTCRTDVKTCLHHVADHTTSTQLQKCMVGGRAVASFRGRIRVEQSAQQTNAQQLSRTIVLTDKCRAWTVPSLEIMADDVQCTHGATVSDLSEEELFYLRSRGLTVRAARNLLMYAFCNDVVEHVPSAVLGSVEPNDTRNGLQRRILERLENLVPTGERAVKGEYQSV